jgi:diguanylate cyclase (GGDEF)-like protein/PAS domain S-box-containing protein
MRSGGLLTPLRRFSIWQVYLAAGALLCALYAWVPPFAGSGPVMNLLGLSPVLAILAGLRLHRPASAGPWWLFAVGFGLFWLGDLYTYSYPRLFGAEVPFPSIGDAAYVLVYPALMAGLLVLVRRRNPERDRAGLIDSLIMTLGLALLSWVALIAPYLQDDGMDTVAKLVSVAYPLGDILLLAAAIRLAVDSGRRQPAFYLLAASIVALLATDFVYGLMTLNGTYDGQVILDAGWISFYLLWGAAALHPSMSDLERPSRDRDLKLTPFRLTLLTGASLIAPVVEALQELHDGDVDLLVIIGASAVLFALVVARMAGLVRQQERSVARERAVGAAGAALVAATGRDDIHRATLAGAAKLIGPSAAALVCALDGDEATVVCSTGTAAPEHRAWTLEPERVAALKAAAADVRAPGIEIDAAWRAELSVRPGHVHAFVLPLDLDGETRGLLVVAGTAADLRPVHGSLQALATQASLALESAALSEEVHRRTSEARFGSLVKHSSDLITVVDAAGIVVYQSPSIEHVLGYTPEELTGTRFERLLDGAENSRLLHLLADAPASAGHGVEVLECSLRHSDGGTRQFEIQHANLLHDEHVRGIVLNSRDVSERKAFEQQLQHQAFHDPVTGLANRALFGERVRHAVARTRREQNGLAVLFIDLDDFKTINDSLGHAAGDQVLLAVAKRLDESIRASDTAARFGGDEFAVLLEGVESAQEAADTAERILDALSQPLTLEHKELVIRSSMGLSVVEGEAAGDADELIRNADAAMYIAKRDGKGGYRLFEPAMHEGVLARLELRADLQRAIASDQLELHYQPVVRLGDGRVSGVEALLRWRHPERGLVPPDQFIPFAEEMGLIVPIGRWVLREGCRQARALNDMLPDGPPLTMAVNLSVKQLQHSDIVGDVRDALERADLAPECLTLEITETVMMTDTELVVQRLKELKELGVRLAMDDFGTGYSSLSYLSKFPVDILKMDRSFLREDASPETAGLATAVVALGETLNLEVVAEGIELPEQWSTLRDLGCDLGQGFLFARPMDADSVLEFLRGQRGPAGAGAGTGAVSEPPRSDGP